MKLSCLQENLSKGLGIVSRAVATRSTLPITQNVLIATDQSRLKLAATNLEIAISCWLGAKIEEEGAITIPARLLTEFVNSLPNDKIDIALNQRTLQLKCARFEARINGLDAQDFPPIPQVADGLATKIEVQALRDGISKVTFAAATEESRPVLTGVQLEFDGDRILYSRPKALGHAAGVTERVPAEEQTSNQPHTHYSQHSDFQPFGNHGTTP